MPQRIGHSGAKTDGSPCSAGKDGRISWGDVMPRRDFCKFLGAGLVMPEFFINLDKSLTLPCAPMLGRPRHDGITVNIVSGGDLLLGLNCRHRPLEGGSWTMVRELAVVGDGVLETRISDLKPGTVHTYEILVGPPARERVAYAGMFATLPMPGTGFSAAFISDMHLAPGYWSRIASCQAACEAALARGVDFTVLLGDNVQTLSSHGGPMSHDGMGPSLYDCLRSSLGHLPAACPVFHVNGNWDGENGWHTEAELASARSARMTYLPNPGPSTYPQGGSRHEDYYAFVWSDVLCVVLNVTGYTMTDHSLGSDVGRADDWTLGEEQFAWLEDVLSASAQPWKIVMTHHTVGGKGADDLNSRYGRGGGQAAFVGEQARVHELFLRHGVQALFYGHDHVFTDEVVDGVHYTCVGSAGAPWLFDRDVTGYDWSVREPGFTLLDYDGLGISVSYVALRNLPMGHVIHTYRIVAD